ncbi:hypothetical protein J3R30DRAFT_2087428 [Lentinula aciculospora]|uniref:Uncharacterized protein n=1 Tax=Lentinula aciculospora TaxID=153920 RepID=A0A9W8ZV00_9AGAR|nr:hypothetical protein J3R30DRAFT_2087428 [Lentinula aciculospora]
MTSNSINSRRNKPGKNGSKNINKDAHIPGGHSREQSVTPSLSSSPLPGGGSGSESAAGIGIGSAGGGQPPTFTGTVPKYIYDFSKALAGEVRNLLAEVGQLRDERRQLQYEIAEIMSMKSNGGGGGGMPNGTGLALMGYDHPDALAYALTHHLDRSLSAPPDPHNPLDPSAPPDSAPTPPAWRTVHKHNRAERKPRGGKKGVAIGSGVGGPGGGPNQTPSFPPLEVSKTNIPAWTQWRPKLTLTLALFPFFYLPANPLLSPTPQHGLFPGVGSDSTPPPQARAGLFGSPSPPPPPPAK